MSNTAEPSTSATTLQQGARSAAGVRRWKRDNQRQQEHVLEQDWRKGKDWNSQAQVESDFQAKTPQTNPGRQMRNRRRAAAWRKATTAPPQVPAPDLSQYRSTKDTGVRDEPLYEFVSGSRPVKRIYSQNLDFSGFPLLCEVTYRELKQINPRLKREMPFCAFLHAMVSCLQAWLFRTLTDVNSEDRYSDERDAMSLIPSEMLVPQPIAEYLSLINTVVTPSGDTVRVNLSDSAMPQHSVEALPPGSFGPVGVENHNAYECYVSPLVTRNFLIASRTQQVNYEPLPAGSYPEGAIPNRNLLGYYPAEQLTPEGRAALDMYNFPDTDDMAGRLQIVPALLQDVSNTVFRCSREFKTVKFHEIQRKPVQTGLVFAKALEVPGNANSGDIARTVSVVHGPYAFGNVTASQAVLFTYRRMRTPTARGMCYTAANNAAIAGWTATMNHNFTMSGEFGPETGVDGPQFRADSHQAFPPDGERENFLADWLKAFRIQR